VLASVPVLEPVAQQPRTQQLMSYLPWNRLHAFMAQATLLVLGGLNVPPSMHN